MFVGERVVLECDWSSEASPCVPSAQSEAGADQLGTSDLTALPRPASDLRALPGSQARALPLLQPVRRDPGAQVIILFPV